MNLNRVQRVDDLVPCNTALISVANKDGIEHLVAELWRVRPALEIYSSGGTFRTITDVAGRLGKDKHLHEVSDYTGQPEMQGGLVKTLDYRIYLGLLSETYNAAHQEDLGRLGALTFDLTVCSFYPFEDAAADTEVGIEDLRTHIDIGGPTMLRASAKNFLRVTALCDSADYSALIEQLESQAGATSLPFRAEMAAKAFKYTAHYENAIAGILGSYIAGTNDWRRSYEVSAGTVAEEEA